MGFPLPSSGLSQYLPRLVAVSLAAAASEAVAGIALGEPALVGSAGMILGFGLAMVGVGRLRGAGRQRWESPLLAASVFGLGVAGAILIPGISFSAAMLPILATVVLLPGRGRAGIAGVLLLAIVGSGLTLLMADIPHPLPAMREPLGSIFIAATFLGTAALLLGAVTIFALQAQASLQSLREALRSHEAAFAERAVIVASIGRLERRDTIKATAELIVDALMKLPDIDLAGVLACEGAELEVLAVTGPVGFPLRAGELLPTVRSRHLLSRMAGGPWAERWTDEPEYPDYAAAFLASGIVGQAYAPFLENGVVMGVVAIGTTSEESADHLISELPAVAEFAATASLLLTPLLTARRQREDGRRAIQTIMDDGSFRPVFQPVVDLASGRTVGFEALTRFVDGRRPDLVFSAAALAGLGLELEVRTLEAALLASRELPAGLWLSLNVSPALVVEGIELPRVLALRDRPFVLEITEHVAIDDYRSVRSAIDRLGGGIRVAVDDAGAGIANFSHLVELRPKIVKVDAGLIRDLDTDLARQAVVVGLVHFAAKAGCEVIAEGIETEAERSTALGLGVTLGQGFLMARPGRAGSFSGRVPLSSPIRSARPLRTRPSVPGVRPSI